MRTAWLLLLITACGDARGPAVRPPQPVAPDAAPAGAADAGAPAPLTEAECAALVDHLLEVGVAEQRADRPPERVPTPAQVAEIRVGLVRDMTPACLTYARAQWTCAMAAATTAAIAACTE